MSQWEKCEPKAFKENTFSMYDDTWAVVAAEKEGKVNFMTISWGSLGILWNEEIATVYVRESRYTREFLDASQTFSITLFDPSFKRVLSDVVGSKSGRNIDKLKESGFTLEHIGATPVFEQARLALLCKKIYRHAFVKQEFCDDTYRQKNYANGDFHIAYIGKIEGMYQK